MPRLKQNADTDAMKDFRAELAAQTARYGASTQEKLGKAIGVCPGTAGNYMRDPQKIQLATLRALVKTFHLDPGVMLKVLGYSTKDIRRLAKNYE